MQDQKSRQRSWTLIAAATVASGGLYYFSLGLEGYRILAWIAPLPVLLLITEVRTGIGATVAFFAYLLGTVSLVPYLSRLVPLPVLLATIVVPSVAFAVAASGFRSALARDHAIDALLVFPTVWTSYEFVLSLISPHGTAGNIAYSQADFLQLIQVCSLTGIWGLTFLLTFVPAGIAVAWYFRRTWKRSVPIALGTLSVIALALLYGSTRSAASTDRQALSVGLVASDSTQKYFDTAEPDQALTITQIFLQQVGQLARLGAKTVLLPEKYVGVTPDDSGSVVGALEDAARSEKVMIIAGLNLIGAAHNRNIALAISDSGMLLASTTRLSSCRASRRATNAGPQSLSFPLHPPRWVCWSARTWIFLAGCVSTRERALGSSSCRPGTLGMTHGCIQEWQCCEASSSDVPLYALLHRVCCRSVTIEATSSRHAVPAFG